MNILHDLDIREVSIVGKAANGRKFLLFKDVEGGKEMNLQELLKDFELEKEDITLLESLQDTISEEQITALAKAMSKKQQDEQEQEEQEEEEQEGETTKTKKKKGTNINEKPVGGFKKEPNPNGNKFVPNKKSCKKSMEDILKSVPAEMQGIFGEILKSQEELMKSNETLVKENKEYKEKQCISEIKETIKKDFSKLPISEDKLIEVLKATKENDSNTFTALSDILGKLNSIVSESNVFKELGSDGGSQGGGAWDRIQQLAKGLVQKDTKLTMAKAIDMVLRDNPKLYEDYEREKGGIR